MDININKYCLHSGIILIVLGLIHLFAKFLSFEFGIILIIIGIISLIIKKPEMFLVFGILLIFIGVTNIITSISLEGGFWLIFGGFQIYWGINEIKNYSKFKKQIIKEIKKKNFVWYGLRIGFWVVIAGWFIDKVILYNGFYDKTPPIFAIILTIIIFVAILFTIVVSIIHLKTYNDKGLPISSILICSTILIITIIFFVFVGQDMFTSIEEHFEVLGEYFQPYSINLNKGEIVNINIESDKNMYFNLMDSENYKIFKEEDRDYEIFVGEGCSQERVNKLDCNFRAYQDEKYYLVLINVENTTVNIDLKIKKIKGENIIINQKKIEKKKGVTQFLKEEESLKEMKIYAAILKKDMDKLLEISNKYEDLTTTSASSNYVAEMIPRLNMYRAHLIEYRDFLNSERYALPNKAEMISPIDERIVEIDTYINQINVAKEQYNQLFYDLY